MPLLLLPIVHLPASFSHPRRVACYTHRILNTTDSLAGVAAYACTVASIVLSIIVSCVQSFPAYRREDNRADAWASVEASCIATFTLDYVLRLVTAPAVPWSDEIDAASTLRAPRCLPPETSYLRWLWRAVLRKLLRFVVSPLNICDAVSIFPYYVELAPALPSTPTAIFRCLRLLRLLRLVVVGGHDGVAAFLRTIWTAADALGLLLFVMCVGLLAFSSAVFYCEQGTWDEASGAFVRPGLFGDLEPTPFISSKRAVRASCLCNRNNWLSFFSIFRLQFRTACGGRP